MSSKQSNLSAANYGYDFVLATTQASINYNLKLYLSELTEPEVKICYVYQNGQPTRIEYSELIKRAKGSCPFSIPDGTDPTKNQDLQNLFAARFMVGFKAQIGISDDIPHHEIPDIVAFGDNPAQVNFTLICSEFIVVQYTPAGGFIDHASWLNKSQPSDKPWLFKSKVDLRLSTADKSEYGKLPPDVQKQIKNLGEDAFSIQQLHFVLDEAALETMPTISGVDATSDLYMILQKYFLNEYFLKLKDHGQPVLGAAILPKKPNNSPFVITDLNYEINPLLDGNGQPIQNPDKGQKNLTTLNYLCATNNHALPPATTFAWNWIEQTERADYHGIVAMNYRTFWDYFFNAKLKPHIQRLCLKPDISLTWSPKAGLFVPHWTINTAPSPDTEDTKQPGVYKCKYQYEANTDAWDPYLDHAWFQIHTYYSLELTLQTNAITITQDVVVYLYLGLLRTERHYEGSFIDQKLTTTYELLVDEQGRLAPKIESHIDRDQSAPMPSDGTDAGRCAQYIVENIDNMTLPNLSLDAIDLQNFIFPGGKTFDFMDVAFSDNLDLVAHIRYSKPH